MPLVAAELGPGLFHLGVVRLRAFGGRLLCVVPITDAPKILDAVIVAAPNVVYVDSRLKAPATIGQRNLTPGVIPPVNLLPQSLPIGRETKLPI